MLSMLPFVAFGQKTALACSIAPDTTQGRWIFELYEWTEVNKWNASNRRQVCKKKLRSAHFSLWVCSHYFDACFLWRHRICVTVFLMTDHSRWFQISGPAMRKTLSPTPVRNEYNFRTIRLLDSLLVGVA